MITKLKVSTIIGIWVLIMALIVILPKQEQQPALAVNKIDDMYLPRTKLEISTTEECAEVKSSGTSEYGTLYMLILTSQLEMNHNKMLQLIKSSGNNGKTIEIGGKNSSTTFCNLQSNTTYFLYYFEESYNAKVRSTIQFRVLQTKCKETFASTVAKNQFAIFMVLIALMCVGIIYLILINVKTWFPNKHLFLNASDNARRTPAEKVKNEWKLDLPEGYKIRMKKKDEKTLQITNRSEGEIMNVNKVLEEDNKEFEDRRICGLCCDRSREVIFLNCGHIYSCTKCAKELKKCPLDNKPIEALLRFRVSGQYTGNNPSMFQSTQNLMEELSSSNSSSFFKSIKNGLDAGEQYIILKDQHDKFNYFYKCIICNQRRKDTLFVNCCHLMCCNQCSKTIQKCPVDGIVITRTHQVFFA